MRVGSMRVHVINLEASVARRAKIEQRLRELGVDYCIAPGVAGREGYTYFEDCDLWRYWLNTGRSPSDGEIGCYASHLRLWRLCALSGEPLVVMEDDAQPLPTLPAALEEAHRLINRYGFLRFEYDGPGRPARTRKLQATGAFSVHYFTKYPYGAMCYALSSDVAFTLVANSRILRAPVDQFIKQCWEHGQPLFGLLPYSVVEGYEAATSTIHDREKRPSGFTRRVRRWAYKLQIAVSRAAFNRRAVQGPSGKR